jgi:molybdopterin-synthase adenylyltransferase
MGGDPFPTPEEAARYRRQIIIPGIGTEGQKRLGSARVCVVGVGGLGSVTAFYLAAAGVGCLRLVEHDRVEAGNLNRQLLHWTPDLGRLKIESAREKLSALNPLISIETVGTNVSPENVDEAVGECAVIVDGTDNLAARKTLNRFAVERSIPFVFGGVEAFGGMLTTVIPGKSPCLECIFPGEDRRRGGGDRGAGPCAGRGGFPPGPGGRQAHPGVGGTNGREAPHVPRA